MNKKIYRAPDGEDGAKMLSGAFWWCIGVILIIVLVLVFGGCEEAWIV